jgi:hypothetical protein
MAIAPLEVTVKRSLTSRSAWVLRTAAGALAGITLSCSHAQAPADTPAGSPAPLPEKDARELAIEIAGETRALLRQEGDLLWQRWTTGGGPAPSSALSGHEHLYEKATLQAILRARDQSTDGGEKRSFGLLFAALGPLAVARGAATSAVALDSARGALTFTAPGDVAPRSERDLDRLLTDEPSAPKRAAIAEAEAAAAAPLAALALAREAQEEQVRALLGLPTWAEMIGGMYGQSTEELARLAEGVLLATQEIAVKAVTSSAQRNLGQPLDRLHRADLPRMVRATAADGELIAGRGWENARATFAGLKLDPLALPEGRKLRVDGEPAPSKASRPLALLVDPAADVRLSFKLTGGFEEQRALLHETARALGGAFTQAPHWEEAQLGDGSAAEAVAWLSESASGDPAWLRERTLVRAEPLDDLVHTEATRRLLSVRRAAALVLFEVRRRAGPQTVESDNALYRSLLARATLAQHGEKEGGRWPLEVDGWIKAAVPLRAALLGAELALAFEPLAAADSVVAAQILARQTVATPTTSPAAAPPQTPVVTTAAAPGDAAAAAPAGPLAPNAWWRSNVDAERLRKLWAQGRALSAEEAARQLNLPFDARSLVALTELRLAYRAPEKPPAAPRPDYKFMQGDRRSRHKAKKRRRH